MNTEFANFEIDSTPYKALIRRSLKSKHVRLQISRTEGLELIIPHRLKNFDVEKFILSKKSWIKKHSAKLNINSNDFYFMGEKLTVFEQFDLFGTDHRFDLEGESLIISCPLNSKLKKEELISKFVRKKAEDYIPKRVAFLASKHGFNYDKVTIRDTKTRWGSCTSKKKLSFSSKLMYFNYKVIDYVIIHELCHLVHLNHSGLFWGLVEETMPMYKLYRKQLNDPLSKM